MDLNSPALESPPANSKGAHSLFFSLVSEWNSFVITSPITSVCQFKFQLVSSTPDKNNTINAVTGILKDIYSQIKEKVLDSPVSNLFIDAFLKHFMILEDTWYKLSLFHFFSQFKLNLNSHWFILSLWLLDF